MNPLALIVIPFLLKTLIDITDWILEGFENKSVAAKRVGSLIGGVALVFAFNFDVFQLMGFTSAVPFITLILTGLMIGRGGNVINDFLATKMGVTK